MFLLGCKETLQTCAIPPSTSDVCSENDDVICDLPEMSSGWPSAESGSDGAQIPAKFLSFFDLKFGMTPRETCDALTEFTLIDVTLHEERGLVAGDAPLTAVSTIEFFSHDVVFEGTDVAVSTSVDLRFSQPQSGQALEDITIYYNFWDDAPVGQVAAMEAELLARFGPPSSQGVENFESGDANTYTWIIGTEEVLNGYETELCPKEDMELFRHRIFNDNTTLETTCNATVIFSPTRSVGTEGRPTRYYLKITDQKRTLENWRADQAALGHR